MVRGSFGWIVDCGIFPSEVEDGAIVVLPTSSLAESGVRHHCLCGISLSLRIGESVAIVPSKAEVDNGANVVAEEEGWSIGESVTKAQIGWHEDILVGLLVHGLYPEWPESQSWSKKSLICMKISFREAELSCVVLSNNARPTRSKREAVRSI